VGRRSDVVGKGGVMWSVGGGGDVVSRGVMWWVGGVMWLVGAGMWLVGGVMWSLGGVMWSEDNNDA